MMNGHGSDDERLIIKPKPKPPSNEGVMRALQNMAVGIDKVFNPQFDGRPGSRTMGFILITFPFGPTVLDQSHKVNSISNATNPNDVIMILEEQIQVLRSKLAPAAPAPGTPESQ